MSRRWHFSLHMFTQALTAGNVGLMLGSLGLCRHDCGLQCWSASHIRPLDPSDSERRVVCRRLYDNYKQRSTPDRVNCVFCDVSVKCQITMGDGVMKMHPVEGGLKIKPGQTIVLKPSDSPLILTDLKHSLQTGDTVEADFQFDKAGTVKAMFPVPTICRNDLQTCVVSRAKRGGERHPLLHRRRSIQSLTQPPTRGYGKQLITVFRTKPLRRLHCCSLRVFCRRRAVRVRSP